MTFAGSVLYIGYLLWVKMLRESITQCMKYRALMIVMLVYAVPWVWLKGIHRRVIGILWLGEVDARAIGLIDIADIETKEAAYQTIEYRILMWATLIWFMISVFFLFVRTFRYLNRRHEFHALAINCQDKNLEPTLLRLGETIRFRRHRPEIVWTLVDNETFMLGAVRPVIFLQKKYAEGDLYWILKHEMTHIVRRDMWVKLLLEFVCCLHWFNPLIYLLGRDIKYLSETSCDERVLKGCTEIERQKYMDLLDRNKNNRQKISLSSALEDNNEVDRRIKLIKENKQVGHRERFIAIGIFVFLTFLNSLTALVYPKVHHVKDAIIEAAEDAVGGENFWMYNYIEDGYGVLTEVILHDEQFVDKDGKIYPATYLEETVCGEHDIVSGVLQIHVKDDDGSCIIETYEGDRCTKCGNVWKGDYLHKTTKSSCTH